MERVDVDEMADDGRAALFEGEPRTVLLTLPADERVPAHSHPDRNVVFHVLSGEVDLDLDDETHRLAGGEVVRFAGDCRISPRARSDARALVVLAER